MKLEILPEAEAELEHAREHYEAERPGLGRDFIHEMRLLTEAVLEGPLHFAKLRRSRTRSALGTRFPYRIVFAILGDTVRVLAVAHQHQRPSYWRGRT